MVEASKSAQLISHAKEMVKQYIAYDGSSRPEYVYTAPTEAADGAPAIVTQYSYDGTSTRIVKRKESATVWDVTWDI